MSSDDLFDDVLPDALVEAPSPTSLASTPAEWSAPVGEPANIVLSSAARLPAAGEGFICPDCSKSVKTKSGFARHMTTHKINDYNSRKPMEEEIRAHLPNICDAVMKEIAAEPAVGEMGAQKKQFLKAFDVNSLEASVSFSSVCSPVIEIVLNKSKIMPSAQYEEMLTKVNQLLARPNFLAGLRLEILNCLPHEKRNFPEAVVDRMLWNIVTKFSCQMQLVVFHSMKRNHQTAHATFSMSDDETRALKEQVGDLVRNVYKFGHNCKNDLWSLRCQCMRKRFVTLDWDDSENSIESSDFLNRKMWQDGSIQLSETCFTFFLGLEKVVQSIQGCGSPCTPESVYDSDTNPENIIILNELRQLSQGIPAEQAALCFSQELIRSYVTLSTRWDAKRKKEIPCIKQKAMNVATRSDLKRNQRKKSDPPKSSTSSEKAGTSQHNIGESSEVPHKDTPASKSKSRTKKKPVAEAIPPSSSRTQKPKPSGSKVVPKKTTSKDAILPTSSRGQKSKASKPKETQFVPKKTTAKKIIPSSSSCVQKSQASGSKDTQSKKRETDATAAPVNPSEPARKSSRVKKPAHK